VRISRYPAGGAHAAPIVHYAPAPMAPMQAAPVAAAPAAIAAPAAPAPAAAAKADHTVTAPMVGTFYSAATPGAKAFVDINCRYGAAPQRSVAGRSDRRDRLQRRGARTTRRGRHYRRRRYHAQRHP
jgi:hypothetical protein